MSGLLSFKWPQPQAVQINPASDFHLDEEDMLAKLRNLPHMDTNFTGKYLKEQLQKASFTSVWGFLTQKKVLLFLWNL